jgi:hypothetical protein
MEDTETALEDFERLREISIRWRFKRLTKEVQGLQSCITLPFREYTRLF